MTPIVTCFMVYLKYKILGTCQSYRIFLIRNVNNFHDKNDIINVIDSNIYRIPSSVTSRKLE